MKFSKPLLKNRDSEDLCFLALLVIMAIYYGYRMFTLTPWYDELYTYYYFISRGPIYAAIHWPVPNNHVGYSVLSACLNAFGNSTIGLRGVSYLCALLNLWLLYRLLKRHLMKGMALVSVLLYASAGLVNQLSIQGRGYTLSVSCFLTAVICLDRICMEGNVNRRYFVLFAIALILGLYTVPSDIYYVLPVCISGGLVLLLHAIDEKRAVPCDFKKTHSFRKLIALIVSAIVAALITVFLYALIWLAIGSNLLIKENESFAGLSHAKVIMHHPVLSMQTGIAYMLASPYIQSVDRDGYLLRLLSWVKQLFVQYYNDCWLIAIVLLLASWICMVFMVLVHKRTKERLLVTVMILTGISIPLMLLVQSKLPYYRVFMYGGVIVAASIGFFFSKLISLWKGKGVYAVLAGTFLFAVSCFAFHGYQNAYGEREELLADALKNSDIASAKSICVTDCTEQYLICFLYGIRCENQQIEGSDFLVLDKKMLDPDYEEMEWEFYVYYNTIPWDYVNNDLQITYENEQFAVFRKV